MNDYNIETFSKHHEQTDKKLRELKLMIIKYLCISVNTVITHRRNIARKLQIHSPAGLTIYAIVNGLVDISSVKL
jgi:hypothetical protein